MIRFLHLSDLHYSETYEKGNICFTRMMRKMTSPLEQIKRVFDNREKDYDFVAITGDICEYGTEKEYAFIHDWLEKYFGCPVIGVSGAVNTFSSELLKLILPMTLPLGLS